MLAIGTPMSEMPNEVLEKIIHYVVGHTKRLVWVSDSSRVVNHAVTNVQECMTDAKSIRLVCRAFAHLESPRRALFGSFYFLPTTATLDRLRGISESVACRPFVERFVFMLAEHGLDPRLVSSTARQLAERQLQKTMTCLKTYLPRFSNIQ